MVVVGFAHKQAESERDKETRKIYENFKKYISQFSKEDQEVLDKLHEKEFYSHVDKISAISDSKQEQVAIVMIDNSIPYQMECKLVCICPEWEAVIKLEDWAYGFKEKFGGVVKKFGSHCYQVVPKDFDEKGWQKLDQEGRLFNYVFKAVYKDETITSYFE